MISLAYLDWVTFVFNTLCLSYNKQSMLPWIESVAAPIFAINLEGIVTGWNRNMAVLTEVADIDVQGKFITEIMVEDDNDVKCWKRALRSAVDSREGTTSSCELSLLPSSVPSEHSSTKKSPMRLNVQVSSYRSSEGTVAGAVCFVTEQNNQKRPAAQMNCVDTTWNPQRPNVFKNVILKNSGVATTTDNSFLRGLLQVLDTCETPLFGVDSFGHINYWNENMAEITGFAKNELKENSFVESCADPSFREELQSIFDRAIRGQGSSFEMDLRTKFGDVRRLLATVTAWKDFDHCNGAEMANTGAFVIAHDITATRAVVDTASQYEFILETAAIPIFGVDCDGCVSTSIVCFIFAVAIVVFPTFFSLRQPKTASSMFGMIKLLR